MKTKNAQGALQRKQFAFKADKVDDDGTFSGYGSVFGNVDSYREVVAPGAFAESLKAIADSGDPLPALWQHRPDEPIGGYDLLAEDERGLKCAGWLMVKEIPLAAQAHALLKRRVVKGLSIGYYVEASDYNEKTGIRTLTKLDLQEISIVTFPANVEALVDDVKSKLSAGQLPSLKEFEKHLREAGFSKTQAAAIANGGLSKLLRSESGDPSQANRTGEKLAALLRTN